MQNSELLEDPDYLNGALQEAMMATLSQHHNITQLERR